MSSITIHVNDDLHVHVVNEAGGGYVLIERVSEKGGVVGGVHIEPSELAGLVAILTADRDELITIGNEVTT